MDQQATTPFIYPPAPRIEPTPHPPDTPQHLTKIPDPYRWMEDSPTTSTNLSSWIAAQNKLATSYLHRIDSTTRSKLKNRLYELFDYDKVGCPRVIGKGEEKEIYYMVKKGLEAQYILVRGEKMKVVMDAKDYVEIVGGNKEEKEKGVVSLGYFCFSKDGKFLAVSLHRKGLDWSDIIVKDVRKENVDKVEIVGGILKKCKFSSMVWTGDGKGFFYTRFDETGEGKLGGKLKNQKLYYHFAHQQQEEDVLVYEDAEHDDYLYGVFTSEDARYLFVSVSAGCGPENLLYYIDLGVDSKFIKDETPHKLVKLIDEFRAEFSVVACVDGLCYFVTDDSAPNKRVIVIDLSNPEEKNWREIVPHHESHVITQAVAVNGTELAIAYMRDVVEYLEVFELGTGKKLYEIPLPGLGSLSLSGRLKDDVLFYRFSSFVDPGSIYRYDLKERRASLWRNITPPNFDASQYYTKQVFFKSKDGTQIPMFITSRKDLSSSANPPTALYGYGGFSISLTPGFSPSSVAWMDVLGGVSAVVNLRGGGEYGEEWHKAGNLSKKQNVFDDYQAAAKALTGHLQVTTRNKLVISGRSNGGLLVGACVNQAPELFGAAIAGVGVHDMLRFVYKTIGSAWVSDYGDPRKKEDFDYIIKYSPLHNVFDPDKTGTPYPPILITTADHDDRVDPMHSFKYAAELQHVAGKSKLQAHNPLLIRIETQAGHGSGKPTSKVIEELQDNLVFISLALDAPLKL